LLGGVVRGGEYHRVGEQSPAAPGTIPLRHRRPTDSANSRGPDARPEHVAPVRDALRAGRTDGPYPSATAPVQAATATEYVFAGATRSWAADDEIEDVAGQLDPLLAALPADVAAQVEGEFGAVGKK
jgi:hypothetical protein